MAEKKDKYLEWVEQGKLRQKLNATHILVKCDVKEVDIAKYLDITVKEYKKLKEKYPEFNRATDPTDPTELVEMVTILQEIAKGYVRTTKRRGYYTNKKGSRNLKSITFILVIRSFLFICLKNSMELNGLKILKNFKLQERS